MLKKLLIVLMLSGTLLHATAPKRGDKWVIGMSQCNLGEPWRVQMNADIKKAADAQPELAVIFKDAQTTR